ncbi:MAG: cadmium-translocating P-type ATPase, partial [Clostridia bacterium]|nr:cadmium-translocating P-type ATPase [Clostridia bacterium]
VFEDADGKMNLSPKQLLENGEIFEIMVVSQLIRGLFLLNIDEEFLMSAAAVAACFIGEFAEAALVLILNFIGQKIEATAAKRSRNSISRLSEIRPDTARLKDGTIISADEVEKGMELVIFPFERIAVDGEVTGGISSVDASAITGESMPISAREGTKLLSGMLNGEGRLFMRADAPAENSTAARIIRLVEESAAVKGSSERLITRFAKIYTPAVMLLCLIVATVPVAFGGSINEWLYKALSILVAACPCALVISVPLAFFAGIGAASKKGILIKGGKFVERLAVCDTAAFDKTGTVTDGTLKIERIYTANGFSEAELLATAKTAELTSSHPIARVICAATNLETDDGEYNEIAGEGVIFSGKKRIVCGSKRLMQDMGIELSDLNNCQVLVAIDGRLAGGFTFTDNIRSDAAEVIRNLKKLGIKNITMLTGDNEKNALTAAKSGNIKNVYFGLLPEDKVDHVARLKKGSSGVIFVGDGINDAPVLAASDVGFAMGLGSDAATFAADAILTANSLFALPDAIKISRKTMKTVRFNVIFPLIIKAAVMISALIYPIMWLAVVADVAVMLLTVLNAARLIK